MLDLRSLSLVVLSLQNTALVLTMRYSRTVPRDETPMYLASVAVACDEAMKLTVCSLVLLYVYLSSERRSGDTFLGFMRREVFPSAFEFFRMSVPAIAYTFQKNLLYVGISNLDAAAFQVAYQGKILTTALFSYLALGKRISAVQVGSLLLLVLGVSLVQLSQLETSAASQPGPKQGNALLGFLAVAGACCTSGFAAVYFEWILKKGSGNSPHVLWVRNFQLASFALLAAVAGVWMKDGSHQGSYFQGFTSLVWTVVSLEAFGGLVVALVVKYADNILKTFATAISIVTSTLVSVLFLNFTVRPFFVLGSLCVLVAVFVYTNGIPGFLNMRYERVASDDVELGVVGKARTLSESNARERVRSLSPDRLVTKD